MTSVGGYLPERVVTNQDLSATVDTSDEWIRQRTGITQRHIVAEGEKTSDLAFNAATRALERANLKGSDIDLIVIATSTPDDTFPSTATRVQHMLGAQQAIAFDVQAVCAGFVFAISVAKSMMLENFYKNCLVIGADSMSKLLNWTDRTTSVLFGDGAGAVVLQKYETEKYNLEDWGILSNALFTDGNHYDLLKTSGGVSTNKTVGSIEMVGKEVFRHAVEKLSSSLNEALRLSNKTIEDIDWLVPHQANQRIILGVADKMKLNHQKIISTVSDHGNTSAASIPLALDSAISSNKIVNGNLIALVTLITM